MNCQNALLVWFAGPAGAIEHPAEGGFYPSHAVGVELGDIGELLSGHGGCGDGGVIGLVDCYC